MSEKIVIEVLFPEFCNLFGDSSNMKYLRQCLPDAEFVETGFTEDPYFADHEPSLIYLGAMSESKQEMVIRKLMPYKERLKELIGRGTPMLFTSNAVEVLGRYIETEEAEQIPALGLYSFYAKRDRMKRVNSLVRGHFNEMEIVGFKTQFTLCYDEPKEKAFLKVDKGLGMNHESRLEGIHDNNLFATYLVGPFFVLNPPFTKYFLHEVLGIQDADLAFEEIAQKAYRRRVQEFHDPKTEY